MDKLVALRDPDSYATFCEVAGAGPVDHAAHAASLPAIDSHSMWPVLSARGANYSRKQAILGDSASALRGPTNVSGVIKELADGELWKLLTGPQPSNFWTGPLFPNATPSPPDADAVGQCGDEGCLIHLSQDPNEQQDLVREPAFASIAATLREEIEAARRTAFSPVRGEQDPRACEVARDKYRLFWGPFAG